MEIWRLKVAAIAIAAGVQAIATLPALPAAAAGSTASHSWHGQAGGIAGRSAYDRGEWIYTDYVFDDHGAASHPFVPDYEDSLYPGDTSGRNFHGTFVYPAAVQTSEAGYDLIDTGYHYNAADLTELRIAMDAQNVYFRSRFNYLPGADKTVLGIGIDADRDHTTGGADWPLGANLHQQNGYEYFLTVYGAGGYLTTYTATGTATTVALSSIPGATVSEDLKAYTFDVAIPRVVMDPGRSTWRIYAGSGLWDAASKTWMQVGPGLPTPTSPGGGGPGLPNVFNLAFRQAEPIYPQSQDGSDFNYWDEAQQAQDLAASDISKDYADVDFGRLQDGVSSSAGDLHGTYERTYTSGFNFGRGLLRDARRPHDDYDYQSPAQPYEVYVPASYDPSRPAPLWVLEHYRGGNYRSYTLSAPGFRSVADALGAITVIPNGRGQYRMCESDAEADFFEVMADVAAHYNIDHERVYLGGMSMGGFCTWRLGLLYPDLFAAAVVYSGWPYSAWPAYGAAGAGPAPAARYDLTSNAANATALPVQVIHGSNDEILPFPDTMGMISGLETAGAEVNVNVYLGRHHDSTFPGVAQEAGIKWLKGRVRVASPPVIQYVINPLTANPDPANGAPADYMSSQGWCNHPPFSGSLGRTTQPGLAFVYDRAYWMQGLQVRNCDQDASVTATSRALAGLRNKPAVRDWSLQSDGLGPFLNEGQSLAPAPAPSSPVVDLQLRGLSAATVDLGGAGITSLPPAGATVNVDTDGSTMLSLRLANPASARAILDGNVYSEGVLAAVSVATAAGRHSVTLVPTAPLAALPNTGSERPHPTPLVGALAAGLCAAFARRRRRALSLRDN